MLSELGLTSGDGLVLAIGTALALAHLLLFVRWRVAVGEGPKSSETPRASVIEPPEELPETDCERPVECPHCGATNDPSYRFCRNCVGEVAASPPAGSLTSTPRSRRMF